MSMVLAKNNQTFLDRAELEKGSFIRRLIPSFDRFDRSAEKKAKRIER